MPKTIFVAFLSFECLEVGYTRDCIRSSFYRSFVMIWANRFWEVQLPSSSALFQESLRGLSGGNSPLSGMTPQATQLDHPFQPSLAHRKIYTNNVRTL